jgi:hypothetical protein
MLGDFSVLLPPVRPPRKRRRPALSCVQCRRRKVKCDRKLPCTQCSQYNNTTCVYDDPKVLARNKESPPTNPGTHNTSSTLLANQSNGIQKSRESALFNTSLTSSPPAPESRTRLGSVSWGAPPLVERVRSELSESSVGAVAPQSEPSVQELKERVRKLETIISRSLNYGQGLNENDPNMSTMNVPKLRGNIDKTRFFGMSHWMNTYDEV